MTNTYTVRTTRDEGWWIATVDEVPRFYHQTKRLDQLEESTRSGLELLPEIEPNPQEATINIIVEPGDELPEEALATRQSALQASKAAKEAQEKAAQLMRKAAKELAAAGLSYRDIGNLLEVSHQRAQQLAKS